MPKLPTISPREIIKKVEALVESSDEKKSVLPKIDKYVNMIKCRKNRCADSATKNEFELLHQRLLNMRRKFSRNSLLGIQRRRKPDASVEYREQASAYRNRMITFKIVNKRCKKLVTFLEKAFPILEEKVLEKVMTCRSLKVNAELKTIYSYPTGEQETIYFATKMDKIFPNTDLMEWFNENVVKHFGERIESFQEGKSGGKLTSIEELTVNVNQYNALSVGTFTELPKEIKDKKAVLNVKNNDDKCLLWSVVAALYPACVHVDRMSSYPIILRRF